MCKRHVKTLAHDRCPTCRETPFRFQENIPMQRLIDDVRDRMGILRPPPSEALDRRPPTPLSDFISYAGWFVQGYPEAAPSVAPEHDRLPLESLREQRRRERVTGVRADHGQKQRMTGRHEGEYCKAPTQALERQMRQHVSECTECKTVWRGRWGVFIGGDGGSTHFDLTECEQGKELNELIGWDYEDPRH
eukprot:TRINITY_DN10965_c0_g1_i4.p1 TRINITY_DN10965_c0_g1~~TRINITY_DN10965_c0_g1_i4.p1  ORF type:complete len:191 (-),score=16.91 TRINITY_DN10965_c0_g1_i4:144-716(-)